MNLESAGFLANLKIFRVIRLLRLIKLLRILKSARILARIQALLGWSYASFELLQYTVFVLMVIHWVACFWGLIGKPVEQCRQLDREDVPDDDGVVACYGGLRASFGVYQDTWLTTLMREKAGAADDETGADAYGRLDLFTTYLYALEFAMCIMVLSYATIEPVTTFERAVALFFMVLGGSIYAYMIGAICGLLSMADPATQEYQNMSDLLNEYIRENMIEGEHKRQLREFFTHCKEGIRLKYYGDLLALLSPAMQKELAMRTHAQRMASIEMFNAADATERARFLADIAVALESSVFPPQEVIFACGDVAEFMYFIHKGVVSCGSSCTVYKSGDHIGLDALLPDNRRETAARTLTFVVSYMLSQEHLYSVLENGDFPQTESKIRRYRAKLALKRKMKEIVALAKAAGLICPDGVRFSENERIFKDRGQVDQFKGTLKPSPSPEEFEIKRAKVLDEIDRDKAEGEKLRKKLELEYLLGREVRRRSRRRAAPSLPSPSVHSAGHGRRQHRRNQPARRQAEGHAQVRAGRGCARGCESENIGPRECRGFHDKEARRRTSRLVEIAHAPFFLRAVHGALQVRALTTVPSRSLFSVVSSFRTRARARTRTSHASEGPQASWCLTERLYNNRLRRFHAQCARAMCRVTMKHVWEHRV